VIDHRAWSPRGINTTLVNEVYARSPIHINENQTLQEALDVLIEDITNAIKDVINQSDSRVKVQRWFPGVVEEVVEETSEHHHQDIRHRLLQEASTNLERKAQLQLNATKEKSYEELMGINPGDKPEERVEDTSNGAGAKAALFSSLAEKSPKGRPRRRQRHKTLSTPVIGGGLFGETVEARSGRDENKRFGRRVSDYSAKKQEDLNFSLQASGVPAEITIKGQIFQIRISQDTWRDLKNGMEGQTRDSRGVPISGIEITAQDDAPVVQRLQGFVRNTGLQRIQEEESVYSEENSNSEKNEA